MAEHRLVHLRGAAHESPTAATVIEAITTGDLDAELAHIVEVAYARLALMAATKSAVARARLHIGDRVRIGHTVKPAYLHEQSGAVVGWDGPRVVVQLDTPIGRFESGRVACSPEAVEPLPDMVMRSRDSSDAAR
jgi:hypothetical protein